MINLTMTTYKLSSFVIHPTYVLYHELYRVSRFQNDTIIRVKMAVNNKKTISLTLTE